MLRKFRQSRRAFCFNQPAPSTNAPRRRPSARCFGDACRFRAMHDGVRPLIGTRPVIGAVLIDCDLALPTTCVGSRVVVLFLCVCVCLSVCFLDTGFIIASSLTHHVQHTQRPRQHEDGRPHRRAPVGSTHTASEHGVATPTPGAKIHGRGQSRALGSVAGGSGGRPGARQVFGGDEGHGCERYVRVSMQRVVDGRFRLLTIPL